MPTSAPFTEKWPTPTVSELRGQYAVSPQLTLWSEVFPASRTRSRADVPAPTTRATSGRNSPDSFASVDPDGSWRKTCQGYSQVTLGRFFGAVLGDLAACGYDAEWNCVSAAEFGAPHRRDRVWLVAYPNEQRCAERGLSERPRRPDLSDAARRGGLGTDSAGQDQGRLLADAARGARQRAASRPAGYAALGGEDVADAEQPGLEGHAWHGPGRVRQARQIPEPDRSTGADDVCDRARIFTTNAGQWREWEPESNIRRVAHGVPARVDRLKGLGNAIVPQIAEWIGRQILAAEGLTR